MAAILTRPTPAHQGAPFHGAAAASEEVKRTQSRTLSL